MKHYSHDINERLTARHYKSMNFCDVKGKRILDIGCSYGWFEKYALDNGCKEIIAFDLNPSAVSFCKRNFKSKRAKFFVASDSKQFKSNSFDLIVCFEVLEHIPKHCEISLFNEVNRLLKKDGKFILSTPNKHFITNLFDPAWYFGHRHYSKNNLTNFSDSSGLKIKSFYICGGFWELSSMILLYIFKWVFRSEIPFKDFFEKKRKMEYKKNDGIATIFMVFKK